MRRRALLLLTLGACASPAPPPTVLVIAAPLPPVGTSAPDAPTQTCTASVVVQPLDLERSMCSVDTKIPGQPGKLTYPCAGGPAEVRFPGVVFRGNVVDGHLAASLDTRFDWDDGCKWASEQHISGPVAGAVLEYGYTEAPLPGQDGCTTSCTARAKVVVRRLQ